MNLPWRNRSIFLPIGTLITLFFVITWHDDSNPVSLRRLIRFAKIKNATEWIYRRSLTRIYEHPARISLFEILFYFFLPPFHLHLILLPFLSSPFLSFLSVFFVYILFLFFFFFLNFSIINSTIISRTLNSTNVLLLYRVPPALSALTDLTASSRNNVKQPSLSSLPVSAKTSSTFTRGNKTFRRWLRATLYKNIFLDVLLLQCSLRIHFELYYIGFFSILVRRIYFLYFVLNYRYIIDGYFHEEIKSN